MRSLAFKIFLAFWTIHAVIFVVLVILPDPGRTTGMLYSLHRDGRLAAAYYENRGVQACAALLAEVEQVDSVEVVLYTEALVAVCASSSAVNDRPFRGLVERADVRGRVETASGREASAMLVSGPSGRRYRVLSAVKPGPTRDDWGPPPPYIWLAVALLVSGVVCLVLARYLAAPLRRMREATHRLKEGDLGARAGIGSRNDEIGDVVRDFDLMADRIQSLVQGQRQLLSDISHELRSPLARLGVALELARRAAGSGAEHHLARIENEAGRMNDLIGRLLTLSRDEQAEPGTGLVDFDLAEIVRTIGEDARYEAERAGKRVDVSGEASALVRGDPVMAASALDNVVRNAVRYTAPNGAVDIVVSCTADSADVTVRDQGPGVPESELERIFLPFVRLDASRTRQSGGIGLGLSIARRSVALMGGTIKAANAPHGGLQVTISLPRRAGPR